MQKVQNSSKNVTLIVNRTERDEQVESITKTLVAANATDPKLFSYMKKLIRVDEYVDKNNIRHITFVPMTSNHIQLEAARLINFVRKNAKTGAITPCFPAKNVTNCVLTQPSFDQFHKIKKLVTAPTILKNGRVISKPRYDIESGIFYHASEPLELGDIEPTPQNVEWAKNLILDDLLGDFPFKSEADKANAVS
ncbi:hypothetical protein PN36_34550 [Candidatus Thiomargarita nelsonii]|uniref:Uncharacterized protein n=1 Tax=Candidatus Thiomargarita nelsonii TaxID=1003181 RepID=A0A4E0RCF2_9GAMM|nr:hypothetical protein PN36_34550 [Candidatus Thiomargarita nelsonii]